MFFFFFVGGGGVFLGLQASLEDFRPRMLWQSPICPISSSGTWFRVFLDFGGFGFRASGVFPGSVFSLILEVSGLGFRVLWLFFP